MVSALPIHFAYLEPTDGMADSHSGSSMMGVYNHGFEGAPGAFNCLKLGWP